MQVILPRLHRIDAKCGRVTRDRPTEGAYVPSYVAVAPAFRIDRSVGGNDVSSGLMRSTLGCPHDEVIAVLAVGIEPFNFHGHYPLTQVFHSRIDAEVQPTPIRPFWHPRPLPVLARLGHHPHADFAGHLTTVVRCRGNPQRVCRGRCQRLDHGARGICEIRVPLHTLVAFGFPLRHRRGNLGVLSPLGRWRFGRASVGRKGSLRQAGASEKQECAHVQASRWQAPASSNSTNTTRLSCS